MTAVGIDLGTSNSAVAVLDADGRPRILTSAAGLTTTPSVVWFADDGIHVGEAALPGLERAPEQTIFAAKRLLGRPIDDPVVRQLSKVLPYALVASPAGATVIALGDGRRVTPEEVAALVLGELRAQAERALGTAVTEAVITVPAWFDSAQRQATKDAAAIAGLEVRRLLSEPTAAALGHGAHRGQDARLVVCDLGGGTFDVSVVDVDGGVFEVLATTGDPFLGGDDVDRAAVELLAREVRERLGVDVTTDATAIDRLRLAAQRAKHELSLAPSTELRAADLATLPSGRPLDFVRRIQRAELDAWAAPLLRRLERPCRDALERAGRAAGAGVDQVLLVCGMTRMPAVATTLERIFGRTPESVANPDEVVAIGAAIEVARLAGDIGGVLLLDVCARGFALSVADGPCDPLIAAGARVPTREQRLVTTTGHGQRRLEFDLWEGEGEQAGARRHLARYAVTDLPEAPAGEVLVIVEVTVDVDGAVRVGATELVSGQRPPLEVVLQAGLGPGEVERLRAQRGVTADAP
ncbi:MAG: Hsp70 family protein [Kofleriaceae bacterium]